MKAGSVKLKSIITKSVFTGLVPYSSYAKYAEFFLVKWSGLVTVFQALILLFIWEADAFLSKTTKICWNLLKMDLATK